MTDTKTRKKDKTDAQKQATIDWYVKHLKEDFNINLPKSAGLNALKAAYEGFEAQKKAHEAELEDAKKSGNKKSKARSTWQKFIDLGAPGHKVTNSMRQALDMPSVVIKAEDDEKITKTMIDNQQDVKKVLSIMYQDGEWLSDAAKQYIEKLFNKVSE